MADESDESKKAVRAMFTSALMDYTKELNEAVKAVKSGLEKAQGAAKCVEGAADLLLDQDAPARLRERFPKATDADNHLVQAGAALQEIVEVGTEAAKVLKALAKQAEHIRYGSRKLYAQLQAQAAGERAAEERARQEQAARQQQMFKDQNRRG